MQNLSDDERKDIEELISDLKPDSFGEEQAEKEILIDGSNGNSESDVIEAEKIEEEVVASQENAEVTSADLLKIISLQNERLGILNKKVDVLTRLVELILRANLEDIG